MIIAPHLYYIAYALNICYDTLFIGMDLLLSRRISCTAYSSLTSSLTFDPTEVPWIQSMIPHGE